MYAPGIADALERAGNELSELREELEARRALDAWEKVDPEERLVSWGDGKICACTWDGIVSSAENHLELARKMGLVP